MEQFDKVKSIKLKGIAIILMMFHHCFRTVNIFKGYSVSFIPFYEHQIVNAAYVSKICVSLFAFVSGFGLFLSCENRTCSAQQWAFKRYIKTFSGYWFIWGFCAIICQLLNGRTFITFFKDGRLKGMFYMFINLLGLDSQFKTPSLNAVWWYMGATILFIVEFILPIGILHKPLTLLGKHSMNIYLIHAFLLSYLKDIIFGCKHFVPITAIVLCMSLIISIMLEELKKVSGYNKHIERLQNKIN